MGWIIFGGIMLLIAALLAAPAIVRVEYAEEVRVKITLLFVTLVRVPPKTKKAAKKDKHAKKAAKDIGKAEESALEDGKKESAPQSGAAKEQSKTPKKKAAKNDKLTLSEIYELAKALVDSLGKPLKKLLRRTRISRLRVNIICGGEDAADAALNFGKTNILIGNILGWIDTFFTLNKPDDIHIGVNFQQEDSSYELSFTARLSLFAALAFLLTVFGRAMGHYRKKPLIQRAIRKLK